MGVTAKVLHNLSRTPKGWLTVDLLQNCLTRFFSLNATIVSFAKTAKETTIAPTPGRQKSVRHDFARDLVHYPVFPIQAGRKAIKVSGNVQVRRCTIKVKPSLPKISHKLTPEFV